MNITRKMVDVEDIFKAIEVDGYSHLRGDWIEFKTTSDGKIRPSGGCLLGMAAINLGVVPESDWTYEHARGEFSTLISAEDIWNEETKEFEEADTVYIAGLLEALNTLKAREELTGLSDDSYVGRSYNQPIGNILVSLNDAEVGSSYVYDYPQLVEFARQLLTPYFGHKLELTQLDFTDSENIAA